MATIFTLEYFTADMVEMLLTFEHFYSYHIPTREQIPIVTTTRTFYVAGHQKMPTVTIEDEAEALLFTIKYSRCILSQLTERNYDN